MEFVGNFSLNRTSNFNAIFKIEGGTVWGNISGNISDQTDLQNELNGLSNQILDINNTMNGYGDVVTHNVSEFATAEQGTLADTALQPNDDISELNNDAGYITSSDVGTANLTIQRNGTGIGTFSANATEALTVNINIPTTATEVGALPSTTTINDLTSSAQQDALNSGVTAATVTQVATNTSSISAINSLIPSGTTASNQLADKNFVNSSISTNTAYFIGTFNSVAELEAYSGTLTNNDYAFVTGTDEQGNTYYDRYKWNGTEWLFEYELNNSSFTSDQWAAINSGITSSSVSAIASNTSAIAGKQDTLVQGSNITISGNTISATNTTYTNGTGLNLSGTTFSVDFTEVATATQGGKADTALQPNDNITQLNNNAGYQANVIETIKVNGTAQTVTSKSVNISVPSAVTETTVSSWGFTKNVGTVTSVNNVSPVNGNVSITIPTVPTNVSAFTNDSGYITNSAITNMQTTTNLVTTISTASTDTTYPSAKCMYDLIGDVETLINAL